MHTQLIIRSVLEHEQFLIGVAMLDRVRSEGEYSHESCHSRASFAIEDPTCLVLGFKRTSVSHFNLPNYTRTLTSW